MRRSRPPRRRISWAYFSSVLRRFNIFIPAISASHCPDGSFALSSGSLGLWMRDRIVGMIPFKRSSGYHHRWVLTIAWVHSKNSAVAFHCAPDLVPKSCRNLIMKRVCKRWGWSGESMEQHQQSAVLSCSRGFMSAGITPVMNGSIACRSTGSRLEATKLSCHWRSLLIFLLVFQ